MGGDSPGDGDPRPLPRRGTQMAVWRGRNGAAAQLYPGAAGGGRRRSGEAARWIWARSMKCLLERYNEAKEDHRLIMSASVEAKLWQREAGSLRQQLHNLQENHKQLLGQQLSGLDVEDLKNLENKMEIGLRNIRLTKDKLMIDQIEELNRKGSLILQENKELYNKINNIHQENIELQKKVNGQGINEPPTVTTVRYSILDKEDGNVPVNLELRQPQNVEPEKSGTPTLGLKMLGG